MKCQSPVPITYSNMPKAQKAVKPIKNTVARIPTHCLLRGFLLSSSREMRCSKIR